MPDTPKRNPEAFSGAYGPDQAQSAARDVHENIASAPPPDSRESEQMARLVTDQNDPADDLFVDDLVAANRFKNFLIGRGVDVPADVINGLSELVTAFNPDIERHYGKAAESDPRVARPVVVTTTPTQASAVSEAPSQGD